MDYFLFEELNTTNSHVCGCAMLNPGWIHMSRTLDVDTVIILGKKNSTFINDYGNIIEIKPNRIVILPAKHHHFGEKKITEAVSYYWLHFNQKNLPNIIDQNTALNILKNPHICRQRLTNAALLPHYFDLPDSNLIMQQFQNLLIEYSRKSYNTVKYTTGIQQLLVTLTEQYIKSITNSKTENSTLVHKIIFKIEENLSDINTSVKYIANILNLNPDYIGRVFKDIMHLSVGNYIIKRRIEIASLRLRETNLSIKEISNQCGFGSVRQLYHHFKISTGKTPNQYREESSIIQINGL